MATQVQSYFTNARQYAVTFQVKNYETFQRVIEEQGLAGMQNSEAFAAFMLTEGTHLITRSEITANGQKNDWGRIMAVRTYGHQGEVTSQQSYKAGLLYADYPTEHHVCLQKPAAAAGQDFGRVAAPVRQSAPLYDFAPKRKPVRKPWIEKVVVREPLPLDWAPQFKRK